MSDKDFKVKNKLQVKGITSAGPVVSDSSGNLDSTAYVATQYGGTGTSTSPSSGQILYSSSGTTYAPTTLTSLVTPVTYSENAPSSPVVGQIWVESDSSADSFDPNIIRRQAFTSTAGQTVYTTSVTFIEGYEQVYFNGLLLLRGTDYTTSNSNTVTLAVAAAVNDIVEVVTVTNLNSVNTYTQAEINSTFAPLSNPTFTAIGGSEGGQINLAAAPSNTTLSGNINLDVYQNRVRLFEGGGNNRGAYVDLTTLSNGVGSELVASSPQSGNTGKHLVTNGTTASWQELNVAGKNAIINGGMDIWQRGTTFTNGGQYTADRWFFDVSASTVTSTRESTIVPAGFQYSWKINKSAGSATATLMAQTIETANAIQFAGKTVTLSFYAAADSATTFTPVLTYSNSADNPRTGSWTNITPTVNGSTSVSTTTFVRIVSTFAVPSTAKSLFMYIEPTIGSGVNIYVTGFQLELGSVATSFSRAGGDIQGELAKCQRYYQKSFQYATAPANNSSDTLGEIIFGRQATSGAVEPQMWVQWKTQMRAAPSVTLYNVYSGTAGQWSDGSTTGANARCFNIGDAAATIDNTDVTLTLANAVIHYAASAEL